MTHIAVIGNYGGWSSEHLADCVARATGNRLLVDMENICLNLDRGNVWYEGTDLTRLDAIIVKKIGPLLLVSSSGSPGNSMTSSWRILERKLSGLPEQSLLIWWFWI